MSELDDAIEAERERRRRDALSAKRVAYFRSNFGPSCVLGGPNTWQPSAVPENLRALYRELLDRARNRPQLWSHERWRIDPPEGAPILVRREDLDEQTRRDGRKWARAWNRYQAEHKPLSCMRIFAHGGDYDSVLVMVTPDGTPWIPQNSYDSGWQSHWPSTFKRAAALLLA